ncbi:MAG: photosynthetic complex assembly protein PuhC [Pseudomonadota bacterium]
MANRQTQTRRPGRETSDELVPTLLLRAVAGLVIICLLMVTGARILGVEPVGRPAAAPIEGVKSLVLHTRRDGTATVTDPAGAMLAELDKEEAGFVIGVERAIARRRMQSGIARTEPVQIVRDIDGRMMVVDPSTDWSLRLRSHGERNAEVFVRLFEAE